MAVSTRIVQSDDFESWYQLWTGYLAHYETTLPDDTKRIAFDRLLAKDTNVHGILALINDKPVGLTHYIFHDHMWRPEGVCYLQDLYADPDIRGQGIGRLLIEAVYAAADEAGRARVYWLTQDFNAPARQLYDRIANVTPFIKYER
ncbi:MAG: GNAT family N-acetyltransferase [Paracoccaceae bacterium]